LIVDFSTYLKIKILCRIFQYLVFHHVVLVVIKLQEILYGKRGVELYGSAPLIFLVLLSAYFLVRFYRFASTLANCLNILANAKFPEINCPAVLLPNAVFHASDTNLVGTL